MRVRLYFFIFYFFWKRLRNYHGSRETLEQHDRTRDFDINMQGE